MKIEVDNLKETKQLNDIKQEHEQQIRADILKDVEKTIDEIITEAIDYKEAMKIQNNCQIEGSGWKEVDIDELNIKLAGMRELREELISKIKGDA